MSLEKFNLNYRLTKPPYWFISTYIKGQTLFMHKDGNFFDINIYSNEKHRFNSRRYIIAVFKEHYPNEILNEC